MLPPELGNILFRVQNSAHYMPTSQMEVDINEKLFKVIRKSFRRIYVLTGKTTQKYPCNSFWFSHFVIIFFFFPDSIVISMKKRVMSQELGKSWREKFKSFDVVPVAAASIGQVHKASLHDDTLVAVKIQYPYVKESIDSDLENLKSLLTFSSLLPKGMYLDNMIKVAQKELSWETDYVREAESTITYRKLLEKKSSMFKVPKVYKEFSTKRVLTTDFLSGIPVGQCISMPSEVRDMVCY